VVPADRPAVGLAFLTKKRTQGARWFLAQLHNSLALI
jgi:hypothetical protein